MRAWRNSREGRRSTISGSKSEKRGSGVAPGPQVLRGLGMGKRIYTVDGHLYIVDDETGKVKEVIIKETNIPVETLEKLIKILAKEANKDD